MFFSLLLWQVLSTAVANEFLTERFAYYSLKLRNISRQSYSSSGNASCDYFDVCESDMDKIVFTVSIH